MTDDKTTPQDTASKNSQIPSIKPQMPSVKTQAPSDKVQTIVPRTPAAESQPSKTEPKVAKTPEPQMKKVDVAIAGVTYSVYCPINEEEELRSTVYHINEFALDLKKEAPNLPQENLLVLCCLNLYEQINIHKKTDQDRRHKDKQTEALVSKIMKDAQSVL